MFAAGKVACIVVYALALAGLAGRLQGAWVVDVEVFAALMLAVHVLELPVALRYLNRYPGPLALSVLLSLLFGLLHWLPLKRAAA